MFKKLLRRTTLVLSLLILLQPASVALADYRYDWWGNAMPSQYSYVAEDAYNGKELQVGDFNNPMDLFVDNNNLIYVLDSGNNRIVVFTEDFNPVKIIDHFRSANGEENITGAEGLFVNKDGKIYLADKANQRVLVSDQEGNITRIITRPDSYLLDASVAFDPKKVLVDDRNIVYIISDKSSQGAYMIDEAGNFLGFYGRNKVMLTVKRLLDVTLRKFATKSQRDKMVNFIPVEFANFDIDEKGFIYTVTAFSDDPFEDSMIKKLNPLGTNIIEDTGWYLWGDMPDFSTTETTWLTNFCDVAVDENHFIYALDKGKCNIYQYEQEGGQLAIFGGNGSTLGRFLNPVAIETLHGKIFVLDNTKKNITVFEPTYFGEISIKAFSMFEDGYYLDSKSLFDEVVKMDQNFEYSLLGLGMAYYEGDNYKAAKKIFERSNVANGKYSEVKKEIRNEWMKEHFAFIFFGIILAAFVFIIASKIISAKVHDMNKRSITKGDK
ncbi:MAG TPA: NHL repeat-containing protein [Mobilitalea sp.]|nr:NHL repeat-containing protein [Mobilitalea sp.]